jgi:hypothetical protein
MVGRVALIDADARIRLAMRACRALTSALLPVVQRGSERARQAGRQDCSFTSRTLPVRLWSSTSIFKRVATFTTFTTTETPYRADTKSA